MKEHIEQLRSTAAPAATWPAQAVRHQGLANAPAGLEFRTIYEYWFQHVARWVRTLGGPAAEREDLVQDVFVVVHRRLPYFDGKNIAGWLYRIARHRVRDFRRLVWVSQISPRSVPLSRAELTDRGASPAQSLETREKRCAAERLLTRLNDSERVALVLFEIEGYTGEEVAEIQRVPLNTVWTRIYKARIKLKAGLARIEGQQRKSA